MKDVNRKPALITGGAGFIGTNVADRLLAEGVPVTILDNLSRAGVEQNLRWLKKTHGDRLQPNIGDIRDRAAIRQALRDAGQVFHFAAQVAVTTSLDDPITDFEINAHGTLNLLEEIRRLDEPPSLVYTSTNKVYGGLEDLEFIDAGKRYEPQSLQVRQNGISEKRSLDFHSPYGCSKGTADQYVIDFARTFGIPATVFRMSCIYGPHQFGNEDQGWVAHFLIKAINGDPLTIYGDGKQVRDILFVEDLVDAFMLAQQNMDLVAGQAFNMGGGPDNTISLLELLEFIDQLEDGKPPLTFSDWRTADQRYYVSDFGKFSEMTGWKPRHRVNDGIVLLHKWLCEFSPVVAARTATGKAEVR